jgi:hypothetical protein
VEAHANVSVLEQCMERFYFGQNEGVGVGRERSLFTEKERGKVISVTFNLILILILTGAGAPQLCRRARTPRKRACATLGAF